MGATDARVFPSEARTGLRDYTGQLVVQFSVAVNGETRATMERNLGEVPVMVRVSARTVGDEGRGWTLGYGRFM